MRDWIWPFPRLRYRLRHGEWCDHRDHRHPAGISWGFSDWRMTDLGRNKIRRCYRCSYTEFFI